MYGKRSLNWVVTILGMATVLPYSFVDLIFAYSELTKFQPPTEFLGAKFVYGKKGCNWVVTILGRVIILP